MRRSDSQDRIGVLGVPTTAPSLSPTSMPGAPCVEATGKCPGARSVGRAHGDVLVGEVVAAASWPAGASRRSQGVIWRGLLLRGPQRVSLPSCIFHT